MEELLLAEPAPSHVFVCRDTDGGSPRTPAGEMGMVFGVLVPTVQSMLGAVLFLRFGWILGQQAPNSFQSQFAHPSSSFLTFSVLPSLSCSCE
eukprot:c22346_g1_i1.p2 GENE.c22346_g1_i1~~c22346_g1_i1.p2  ORF type:complete len:109 (+),score=25.56 c22346_g1_i1:51-329(+)